MGLRRRRPTRFAIGPPPSLAVDVDAPPSATPLGVVPFLAGGRAEDRITPVGQLSLRLAVRMTAPTKEHVAVDLVHREGTGRERVLGGLPLRLEVNEV